MRHAGDLLEKIVSLGVPGHDLRTAQAGGAAFLPEPAAVQHPPSIRSVDTALRS
jgi:hypothetical protein